MKQFSNVQLAPIHTGYFKLDGGAMFGVVPKKMWAKILPPDEDNYCTWSMRALLIQTGSRNIIVDTGIGNKQDEKFRSHFMPFGEETLFGSIAKAGLSRNDITDVFLTHLHFDHCGGALWKNETTGVVEPAFPNAVYWTNERHYNWAINPNYREKASFLKENFVPLREMGLLRFVPVRQNYAFDKNIRIRFVYGHTEAMMLPEIKTDKGTVVYCADLFPSSFHFGMPYVMAYDIRPLQTLKEREAVLARAVAQRQVLLLEHDPYHEGVRVAADASGKVTVAAVGKLEDLWSR